jgi:predicted ATP-grasp superfamily ATP-dependent carboligase
MTLLGVIRVLGRAGVRAYAVTGDDDFACRSRYFHRPPAAPPADSSQREFEAFLERLPVERAVLIGCSDTWAHRVASLRPGLKDRFPSSSSGPDVIETFVDKLRFAETARAAGVAIPYTAAVDDQHLPDESLFDEPHNFFLKPRHSEAFLRDYGVKAFWTASPARLHEALARARAGGHEMILQEYVPGPADNHYFIDGFVDERGRVVAALARRRIRMFPRDFGNSSYLTTVPIAEVDDAAGAIERLTAHVKYRGIFSAEFKRDERDGCCRMLELNTRPWVYVEFAARCGVDVCSLAYDDALGEPVETIERYDEGRSLVYPYGDWLACRELRRRGMGWAEVLRDWRGADHPLLSWSDPVPGIVADLRVLLRFSRNRARRLFERARRHGDRA